MSQLIEQQMESVVFRFRVKGKVKSIQAFGNGHINRSYIVTMVEGGEEKRYTLQQINTSVFRNPDELMENIQSITAHIRRKLREEGKDPERGTLHMMSDRAGEHRYVKDAYGSYWRMYPFIDDCISYDIVDCPEVFRNAARAFGTFQAQLADYPAYTLNETIPHFHDTGSRYMDFEAAVARDLVGRAESVQEEIAFVRAHRKETYLIQNAIIAGEIPVRVTHNDTKLNNVLMDKENNAVCVVDLDTVMPGSALYDFGDSIRFGASTALEDEEDLSKVQLDLELFEAFADGYLETAGPAMTTKEIEWLPFAAKMMTLECGIRFLTDYLNGDTYFKIAHAEHNLVRARTQFKLVQEDEDKMEEMQAIIRALVHKYTGK